MSPYNGNGGEETLTRGESIVALGVAAANVAEGDEYVTVKTVADQLGRNPATVRTQLNDLRRYGVTESTEEALSVCPDSTDPREKYWALTYGTPPDGVERLLDDHPEIEDYVREDDIAALLSGKTPGPAATRQGQNQQDFPTKDRIDNLMQDYPEVVEYFGGEDAVYDLFDLPEDVEE